MLGYGVWLMLSQSQQTTLNLEIPICYYNLQSDLIIKGPETITVSLTGKRTDIFALDHKNLALHLDGSTLVPGTHPIDVSAKILFLPSAIKLVHYSPLNAVITVHSANATSLGTHQNVVA